jgi:hypothetical protein
MSAAFRAAKSPSAGILRSVALGTPRWLIGFALTMLGIVLGERIHPGQYVGAVTLTFSIAGGCVMYSVTPRSVRERLGVLIWLGSGVVGIFLCLAVYPSWGGQMLVFAFVIMAGFVGRFVNNGGHWTKAPESLEHAASASSSWRTWASRDNPRQAGLVIGPTASSRGSIRSGGDKEPGGD